MKTIISSSLFLVCLLASALPSAAGVDPVLPKCRSVGETRAPIPMWSEDLTGLRELIAAPQPAPGKIVYMQFSAEDVEVEETDVAYSVRLQPKEKDDGRGSIKVIFWGKRHFANGSYFFSGFFDLQHETADKNEVTFRRLDTFDIVSSRRFCLGDHFADAPRPVASAPSVRKSEPQASLPWCGRSREDRIPIEMWKPKLTEEGELRSEPPTGDGKIVYISFQASQERCGDPDKLFSFPLRYHGKTLEGLAVNLRGNNESFAGGCRFSGFYMNEPVFGVHQGWIETYFGPIDKDRIIATGQYCISRRSSRRLELEPR